jgi:NAD(P)H-hydrate epimerase
MIDTMKYHCKTDMGLEVTAVTAEQMKELDRIAIEETGPNLYQMMENAGRNLASFIIDILGIKWRDRTILILAGSGGNGGGGICAARHLANQGGKVILCSPPPDMLSGVTLFQHKVFTATSGRETLPDELPEIGADIIIDAIIGYGLKSAPRERAAALIDWTNNAKLPVVSLDVPSGVDATSGETPGIAINAAYTVTLALPKTGLAGKHSGSLYLADIGIPEKAFRQLGVNYKNPYNGRYIVPFTFEDI